MGVGIGDYNLDGHLDLFKGHFTDDTTALYRNDGKGNFNDVTLSAGLGVETRFTGWGAGIVDLDNDGYPDLFLVTGNVYPEIDGKVPGYPYKTPRVIFRNLGNGKFEELIEGAGPGLEALHSSRGCAFGDFDNDGDLDILIINLNEPPSLLLARRERRPPLAQGATDRHEIQSQRDWRARAGAVWRQAAGSGSNQPVQLLLYQRPQPAFRFGKIRDGRPGNPMAGRRQADLFEARFQPALCDPRRLGYSAARALAWALRNRSRGYQKCATTALGGPDLPLITLVEITIWTFLWAQFRGACAAMVSM